ncbi:MAG: AAA family ATPase [Saprospiraceae bacterium]|nr:AAA family ATPase [Saprospiraceae bacterium]
MNSISRLLEAYKDNQKAVDAIRLIHHTRSSVFLTGKPGTGKSTLLQLLTSHIHKKHIVLTPTERSALQVGGEDIHSFFGFKKHIFLPEETETQFISAAKRKLLYEIELIIIDEISLLRCDMMNAIDLALRTTLGNDLPFGGKQLLMIGDLYQLPPELDSQDKETINILRSNYSSRYFFSAKAFENNFEYQIIELSIVYGQKDKEFLSLLNAIRINKVNSNHLDMLNERHGVKGGLPLNFKITLVSSSAEKKKINESNLETLDSNLVTFNGEQTGNFASTASAYPTNPSLELKNGAQIMFVKDDNDGRWNNGTIGRIVSIFEDKLLIEIKSGNGTKKHNVLRHTWHKYNYKWNEESESIDKEITGTFTQFPIKLAWGITIQNSLGQTFNHVIINLGRKAFASGQTYVALSRCTSLKGITLKRPINAEDIFVDKRINRFLETQKQYTIDKDRHMDLIDNNERSVKQQHLIIEALEVQSLTIKETQQKLLKTLHEQSKKIKIQDKDLNTAKDNLNERQLKLNQAEAELIECEAEKNMIVKSKDISQMLIIILSIALIWFIFN